MRIEVSHESPLQFLDYSLTYNDYDYALVHLFEQYPDYYEFFYQNKLRNNRKVYLDNSIFELGESFDAEKYAEWINKLNPTYYIVPDTLENADETVEKFINFQHTHKPQACASCSKTSSKVEPLQIGVVQGRDWYELTECYRFMSHMADMVAISFDYSYYLFTGTTNITPPAGSNGHWYNIMYDSAYVQPDQSQVDSRTCDQCRDKMQRFKTGRQAFIQRLIDENIWNWNKPHHLLGCSLADEMRYYVDKNIHNIVSVDTSNPVVAALKGYRYQDERGLQFKPTDKLADMIEFKCSDDEATNVMRDISYNAKMFKKILRRY